MPFAAELFRRLGVPLRSAPGSAENIPMPAGSFDLVVAASVLEHVLDLDLTVAEVHRVLKPGGVFWFSSASALCPYQHEIRGFPLFGWYPRALKARIMRWACASRPDLVGFTRTPAVHWFSPWGARRLLRHHGSREVYDRMTLA